MTRIAITRFEHKGVPYTAYCGLDEQRNLTEFQLFSVEQESILDQIVIARVERILPNLNAAFVKISNEQTCYLPLADAKQPIYTQKKAKKPELCVGDELLVQIVREAVKTKDAVCSAKISLHGQHCVVTSGNHSLGISKKLPKEQAEQLHGLLTVLLADDLNRDFGIVLRTSAATVSQDLLVKDIQETIERYATLKRESVCKSVFSVVHKNPSGYVKALKSVNSSRIDKIYTDVPELYKELQVAFENTKIEELIEFYQDSQVSLSTLYHLNGQIDKLIQQKVWLDSGANIIIEQLETMTVIDINSGKNQAKKPDVIKSVNLEAAKEVARQLRLRNISGMIIIDFINMKSKEDEQEVIACLKKEFHYDTVPCSFIDITKLGLVEVTRKKVQQSLKDILKNK